MIAFVICAFLSVVSLTIAFFLAVANMQFLLEADFMNRAKTNSLMHSLSWGQLQYRANRLTPSNRNTTVIVPAIRRSGSGQYKHSYNKVNSTVKLDVINNSLACDLKIE